jgi:hypothetical protein
MPRTVNPLTAVKVRTVTLGRYGDGGGLYLLVKPPGPKQAAAGGKDGGRYWLFRYRLNGRMRELGWAWLTGKGQWP